MRNKKNVIIAVMCIAALIMATGYAYFATRLNINVTGNITSQWNIYFSNITSGTIVGSATNKTTPSITATTANVDVNLALPGDSITYELTLTNGGTVAAVIDEVTIEETGSSAIIATIEGIEEGDKLAGGSSVVITLKIEYDSSVTSQPADTTKKVTMSINAVQDTGQSAAPSIPSNPSIVENSFAATVLANNTIQSDSEINFGAINSDTNGKGMYYTNDNDGVTYYFRGDVDNNYVQFGNVTYNYQIKYEDYPMGAFGYTGEYFVTESECNSFANSKDTEGGVYGYSCESMAPRTGAMYWRIIRVNGDGTVRLIYDGFEKVENGTSHNASIGTGESYFYEGEVEMEYYNGSLIEAEVNAWYDNYLKTNYGSYVATSSYCHDTSDSYIEDEELGYPIYHPSYVNLAINKQPSLICGSQKLTVGLLTADEYSLAGGVYGIANNSLYLYSGNTEWTMSPAGNLPAHTKVMYIKSDGAIDEDENAYDKRAARPVVNISTSVSVSTGDGTIGTPYILKLN